MVRLSKPSRRRAISYKRPSIPGHKGPSVVTIRKKHTNVLESKQNFVAFIPPIS